MLPYSVSHWFSTYKSTCAKMVHNCHDFQCKLLLETAFLLVGRDPFLEEEEESSLSFCSFPVLWENKLLAPQWMAYASYQSQVWQSEFFNEKLLEISARKEGTLY